MGNKILLRKARAGLYERGKKLQLSYDFTAGHQVYITSITPEKLLKMCCPRTKKSELDVEITE